jgi:hypothetical protein
MSEIGEAIVRGNAATIEAQECPRCLTKEAIVLKLEVPTANRVLVNVELLRGHPARQINLAVVQAALPQFAAQFDPQQPRNGAHDAPRWRI